MLNDFKRQVVELLKSLGTGDRFPLAAINPNKYIQHNLRAAVGLAGFRERLESLPKGAAKVNTVRGFQDGNFVFTPTEYNVGGPRIGFDFSISRRKDRGALGQPPAGRGRTDFERPHDDGWPDGCVRSRQD